MKKYIYIFFGFIIGAIFAACAAGIAAPLLQTSATDASTLSGSDLATFLTGSWSGTQNLGNEYTDGTSSLNFDITFNSDGSYSCSGEEKNASDGVTTSATVGYGSSLCGQATPDDTSTYVTTRTPLQWSVDGKILRLKLNWSYTDSTGAQYSTNYFYHFTLLTTNTDGSIQLDSASSAYFDLSRQ